MRIEHVALWVKDLNIIKDFYKKYFGTQTSELYHNSRTGFKSYFLTFDDKTRLEIMTRADIKDTNRENVFGFAHISISVGSKQQVDKMTAIIANDGFTVVSNPRTTGDGCYESSIKDPEGNIIEITE